MLVVNQVCQGDDVGAEVTVVVCRGDKVGATSWPVFYETVVGWVDCMLVESEFLAYRVAVVSWVCWGDIIGDEEGFLAE